LYWEKNYLLSFQEELTDDIFTPVLNRLEASVGKTRRNGPDYLLFALMDVVVDNYFIVLEKLGDSLDYTEDQVIRGSEDLSLKELYALKRELTMARRQIWPLRDMINQLIREDNSLIEKEVIPYFRDLYDHVMQVLDTIDSYRELLASLADVHLVNHQQQDEFRHENADGLFCHFHAFDIHCGRLRDEL
jgi:magnesium transporter